MYARVSSRGKVRVVQALASMACSHDDDVVPDLDRQSAAQVAQKAGKVSAVLSESRTDT